MDNLPENPREQQQLLAKEVVTQYHGEQAALEAEKAAASGGKAGEVPEYSLSEVEFPAKLFYLLNASGLCKSSGEGRRKITEGGVRLDGEKITYTDKTFDTAEELQGKVLQLGKKKFVKLLQ